MSGQSKEVYTYLSYGKSAYFINLFDGLEAPWAESHEYALDDDDGSI